MFVYYNVIWILCMLLLFTSLYMFFRRKRVLNTGSSVPNPANPNFVIVDMNGRQSFQPTNPATYAPLPPQTSAQTFYRPPENNSVEPPPPSYQDYSKDYRVQHSQ